MILLGLLFMTLLSAQAIAAELPPAATPGGALPQEGFKYPQPFNYPKATPPPEIEKKIEQVEKDAPRMKIRGFKINGVKAHEEVGITQASVDQVVKQIAEEMVAGVAANGFTISMLEALTGQIATFYRSKGYFLARAYIPEQTVTDGIVQINIVEGFLDDVVYVGNRLYSNQQLEAVLKPLIGQSVYKPAIDEALYTLNDYPGLTSKMIFGPGLKPGSAAIQLKSSEVASATRLSVDNFGSTYTGENRLRLNHRQNNLFGQADLLDVDLILTTNPANSRYVAGSYQQPVINHRIKAGGGFSYNSFDVGGNLSDLGVNGESVDAYGSMHYIFRRSRSERLTASGELHVKSSSSSAISSQFTDDQLTVLTVAGDYAGTSWSSSGAYQTAHLKLSLGFGDSTETSPTYVVSDAAFSKLSYRYSRLQRLTDLSSLLFTLRGQQSSDSLTSLEKMSLGGPDTVRAYPVADALMDSAWVFSAEYKAVASPDTHLTWLNNLTLSVFYDMARGTLNDALPNEKSSVSFSGLGGSVQARPYKKFDIKLTAAIDLGDTPTDNRSLPFYFSLNYRF